MSSLRSRRLESVFGAELDAVTAEHIQSLVANGVTETFDLDFKEELYGRSDSAKRDLVGDVAALANTAGGVIVIGVAEDDQARATAAPGVELSDAEKGRMLQVIASGLSPLPAIDIIPVPVSERSDGEDPGPDGDDSVDASPVTGYFLVAVPRSPAGPHAVIVNDGFRFPKRNGSTTRYLSEPEVAAEYRERFARTASQGARIEQVEQELRSRLHAEDMPWLIVSLVPDLPGELELTHALREKFTREVLRKDVRICVRIGISFMRAHVGRRRLVADGSSSGEAKSRWVAAEFHCDGAGAFGQYVPDLRADSSTPDRETQEQLVSDEGLVLAVMSGLHHLAVHARDQAATAGNSLVRATLVPSNGCSVEIGHNRQMFRDSRSSVGTTESVSAESMADIDDLADPGPELTATAARLSDELAQSFGIAELGQVTRQGEFRLRYWGSNQQREVRAWAEAHGINATNDSLG